MIAARDRWVARGIACAPAPYPYRGVDTERLGPMCALELVHDRNTREPAPDLAKATVARALENGLILLTCALYGNVVRVLVPLVVSDEDLSRGLDILEEALTS